MNAGSKRTRAIELRLKAIEARLDALESAVFDGPVANSGGGPGSEDNGGGDPPSGGGPGSEDNGGGPG